MKKITILLSLLVLTYADLNAQFKKITGTPKKITEPIQLLKPIKKVAGTGGREIESFTFKPNMTFSRRTQFGDFKVLAFDEEGLPIAIEGVARNMKGNRNLTTEQKASSHIKEISPLMKTRDASQEFVVKEVKKSGNQNHIKMSQMWNNIPVYGGEVMLHENKDGDIDFINGRYKVKPDNLISNPALTVSEINKIVSADLGGLSPLPMIGSELKQIESKLEYYSQNSKFYLVYHLSVYKNLISKWEYFVDSQTGEILQKFEAICKFHNHKNGQVQCSHTDKSIERELPKNNLNNLMDGNVTANAFDLFNISRSINVYQVGSSYYMIDGNRPMFNQTSNMPDEPEGTIWTIDAFNTAPQNDNFKYDHVKSSNNTWTSKTSVSAHYNGGKAYDYFRNTHSRNSINGQGGNIVSLINIADEDGSSLGNAFWNGQAMFYGNGDSAFNPLARGLDVAGHEMTHGVVQNTANLEYMGESGALNESFADVFGVLIDREDWLIGEDVVKTSTFPSGALRSMSDPHNGGTSLATPGYQPKKYSERYTGSEDNGGVHINSGIPNHAFFLFASNAAVGKDKAEKVYYEALDKYLSLSSKFIDCRVAVVRAAKELYGDNIAAIATQAFDAVGIPGSGGGGTGGTSADKYENDLAENPGNDLILFTDDGKQDLYLFTADGKNLIQNGGPLTETDPISRPSISDDGSLIVFVASDKKIHYISIDWVNGQLSEDIIQFGGVNEWRNAAISKDGNRLAALTDEINNQMVIANFEAQSNNVATYELSNPTFTQGVKTGDVKYADAIEWDYSGEYVMYDAENEIKSTTVGTTINYWDIGFIKVWNKAPKTFALPDQIQKLFPTLEEGISVGNPTFSKNSPYIIAFDYLEGDDVAVLGLNIERTNVELITDNNGVVAYPNYAGDDKLLIFNAEPLFSKNIDFIELDNTKIKGVSSNSGTVFEDAEWGVWFRNGQRSLEVGTLNLNNKADQFSVLPNLAYDHIRLELNSYSNTKYIIRDVLGNIRIIGSLSGNNAIQIQDLNSGIYFIEAIQSNKSIGVQKFTKL